MKISLLDITVPIFIMDYLKKYFEIQRSENEALKQEIISKLENLLSPLDIPLSPVNRSPAKYCNYIAELCHFEQKINHKLTDINFELRKFSIQNKCPDVEPPPIKVEEPDDSFEDIETLKANSNKLILRLDKLREKQLQENNKNLTLKCELNKHTKTLFKDVEEVCSQHSGPLICLETDFIDKSDENVLSDSKFNKLSLDKTTLTREENSVKGKYDYINNPITTTKECEVDQVAGQYPILKDLGEIFSLETEVVVNEGESGQANENILTISELNDSISEIMWKNVMELSSSIPATSVCQTNIKIASADPFELLYQIKAQPEENPHQEIIAENTEKFFNLESDGDISSCYDSASDLGMFFSAEENLEGIPKYQQESNFNLCDSSVSSKEGNLKELNGDENKVNYVSGELQNQDVQEINKHLQLPSMGDLDRGHSKEEEERLNQSGEIANPTNYSKVASDLIEQKLECVKHVFSAEEKIRKLGLEDRRTIFEKTKKAAVLPDLRLRPSEPSVSDTEKLRHLRNKNSKFEIADNNAPLLNSCCVFSHVESPSEFYIHPNTEESKLIDCLNDLITDVYKKSTTPYDSKFEAFEDIGRYCCAYVKDDKTYYRTEVTDWLFGKTEKLVKVKLVDYGNTVYAHYKHLRVLTQQFCLLPKLAIKCYFPLIYPPGSTKHNLLTEWPGQSTEAFFELAGLSVENNNALFRVVYVEEEKDRVGIDLQQINGPDLNTIGQLLIDLGHAVQIVLEEDDPMGILSDEEDIKSLEQCDNINEVVLGYDPKDEARICKFTTPDGGRCFKKKCMLEHAKFTRGGFTTDQTLTYAEALVDLRLPKPNEYTAIRFTTFIKPTCFYVNLVCYVEKLRHLEEIMNNPVNCRTFESYKVLPAHGEIVLVKHWQKRWLRGKVRHHLFNENGKCTGVQVFMVDYGDIIDVALNNIKQMKGEYLNLPFQAIECILHNYEEGEEFGEQELNRFFYDNMVFRPFMAKIIAVTDITMCAEVHFKDRLLGDILVDYGFLMKVNKKVILPHPKSVIIPG